MPETRSRAIAAIVGPTLVALAVTEGLNMDIYSVQTPNVVYLNGTVLFVGGLAVVRFHPVWQWNWRGLVTVVGWMAAAVGLFRMAMPGAPQAGESLATYVGLGVLGLIGLVLTVMAYRPRGS